MVSLITAITVPHKLVSMVSGPAPEQPARDPLSIFTDDFLLLMAGNRISACGPLAEALDLLAKRGLITIYCPDARSDLHTRHGFHQGEVEFHASATSACHNENVQINCETER